LLYPERLQDLAAFERLPPDLSPAERLRRYLPNISALANPAVDGGGGTRQAPDDAHCESLTSEDLERIAEAYLDLPDVVPEKENSGGGLTRPQRAAGEAATTFLDRVLKDRHQRFSTGITNKFKEFSDRFGPKLADSFAQIGKQSEILRQTASSSLDHLRESFSDQLLNRAEASRLRIDMPPPYPVGKAESLRLPDNALQAVESANKRQREERAEEMLLARRNVAMTEQAATLLADVSQTASEFLSRFAVESQKHQKEMGNAFYLAIASLIATLIVAMVGVDIAWITLQAEAEAQPQALGEPPHAARPRSLCSRPARATSYRTGVRPARDRQSTDGCTAA